jgi:hypothetical protein
MKNVGKSVRDMDTNEQNCNNGSLYLLLYEFERSMRSFIIYIAEKHLREHYNDNWEEEFYGKISKSLLKDIIKACEREKDIAIYTGMNINYVKEDFLSFSFISEATISWWDQIFVKYFKHQQYFKTDIDKIKNVRNALSHFRETTTESQLETFSICKRLLSIVYSNMPSGVYSSITNIDSLFDLKKNDTNQSNYCDIHKVYTARSDVQGDLQALLKVATKVEAIGISINELTLKLGDKDYIRALERGAEFTLLFLDPDGVNVGIREDEENVEKNHIANATRKNLSRLNRLRTELEFDGKENLYEQIEIILYDDIPRCNLVFIDDKVLFAQYYANYVKGENNPTFYIVNDGSDGIYSFYRKIFDRTKRRYIQSPKHKQV